MNRWDAFNDSNLANLRSMNLTVQKEQCTVRLGKILSYYLPGVIAGYCSKFFLFSPFRECGQKIQFKNFAEHVIEENCATDLKDVEDFDYIRGYGMSLPYVLSRQMVWDGSSEKPNPPYNLEEDGNWRLMLELL